MQESQSMVTSGVSFLIALGAGALSGIASPIILSLLKHQWIWKNQKRLEVKYSIFNDAVRALGMYATDALDHGLQSEKKSYRGQMREVEVRPETSALLERSRSMISAFFSEDALRLYQEASYARILIEEHPWTKFENKRTTAIIKLSEELGLK